MEDLMQEQIGYDTTPLTATQQSEKNGGTVKINYHN